MSINVKNSVPILDVSQDFGAATRLVDENGSVVILQNGVPSYIMIEYNLAQQTIASDEDVRRIGDAVLEEYLDSFLELAKDD
ncbi:MAG: type II toxin-antitoxin system Phd/YefM family antitoxin [Defluviitaleaceae bacterium]|nr:type II toxin-antitoxin system Phd/YefM family antitoxin [Defluviitaleaceae bacterium]